MIHFNTRTKSAILACTMIVSQSFMLADATLPLPTTTATSTYNNPIPELTAFMHDHKIACAVITTLLVMARIQLKAKGTDYNYKLEDWHNDLSSLLKCYNIFDIESYKTVLHLINKWVVGRRLKFVEKTTRDKKDDGTVVTIKDHKIASTPFGAMGLFDAYVLYPMKDLTDYIPTIAAFCYLLTDPLHAVAKAQSK
jgi:hypothetical protein